MNTKHIENIPNTRTKVNFKTYKIVCQKLNEEIYKRNSIEKEEQLKRWEIEHNIFKKKDNSFTCINKEFETKKQIQKREALERKEEKANMLKIKFTQIKNIVIMEILNQNKINLNDINKQFVASNGFIIEIQPNHFKIFNEHKIHIPNDILASNNKVTSYEFDLEETAISFIKEACVAVKEYNNKNKKRKTNKNIFIAQ